MARRTVAAPHGRPAAHTGIAAHAPLPRPGTACVPFRAVPAAGGHLLAVVAGMEGETARQEAADLEDAVRRLLGVSIETGTDGSTAYLCEFALDAARALRAASGLGV